MPKTRKHKQTSGRAPTVSARSTTSRAIANQPVSPPTNRQTSQRGLSIASPSMQNLAFSVMAALGFWGFGFFFIFLYAADPNHYLYGGLMVFTALGWSFIAYRKWLSLQQGRVRATK